MEITSYGPVVYTIDTDCTGGIGYANNVWIEYNFTNHKKKKIADPRWESFMEGIKGEFK
jgi:hypothetical protein